MNPPATPTILVVDDEPKAQVLLRTLLEAEGYRVICAADGPSALAAANTAHPDVVLLDLMMPGMDGYEVCGKLRAAPALAAVPVIMLTALDDRSSRLQGLQAGADDFLAKPFDAAELRARLRTITRLNRYRLLYEKQAHFEAAIDHAPEGIVLTEPDGTILHRNAAFNALFAPAMPSPVNFLDCLPEAIAVALRTEIAGGPRRPAHEAPLRHGRARETTVEITHGPIPWEGREIVQFHVRDLTDRKALEAQLLRSQRIEILGQLAGSVVHDMNNVLTAIGGSAALIEMGAQNPAQQLHNIQRGVERGGSMMRQLLAFARGSDGELESCRIAGVAAEAVDLLRDTLGRRVQVQLDANPDLAAVVADPTQVHQIVMNLCVNARDAMPDGGRITLTVGRRQVDGAAATAAGPDIAAGEYVTLAVRDTGTGIPPEILPRLFDPFFTTKEEGKGTGLGLATVQRLMRRHHGFVTIDTAVGRGTCFTCHFPMPAGLVPATPALAAVA